MKKLLKNIGIGFAILVLVTLVAAFKYGEVPEPKEQPTQSDSVENTAVEVSETKEDASAPVVHRDIVVTSQIVKKVSGKCRYFFDIRNNDVEAFEGSVEIRLLKPSGSALGKETFNTTKPIEATLGNSVYFDINTCPGLASDESRISDYSYKVFVGKDVVAEGKDLISEKYENLNW